VVRRAIELDPTNAKARFNLGNMGEYQAAVILFRDLAALDPWAHFNLVLTGEQLGRAEGAQGSSLAEAGRGTLTPVNDADDHLGLSLLAFYEEHCRCGDL